MPSVKVPKPRILSIGAIGFLAVAWLGWYAPLWIGVEGRWWVWGVRTLVWLLGSLAVGLVLKLLPKGRATPAVKEADIIDGLLTEATKRLNAIGVRGRAALARLPVVLVLGPRGSAKTTFVLQSDLDADLLAGNVHSAERVGPTDAVNLWYRDGLVLVEAAGQLSVEPARWGRLVEKLRPRQWIPALTNRPQAPRVAVVCFSLEDLTGPGTADPHLAAARTLRSRLNELAEGIGVRLPVYVVFTKTDRVPHFEEFVRNMTDDEVHDLLGATLRSSSDGALGSYAERETERLSRAFEELFNGLAERRLDVLGRAGAKQGNGPAYEFPREFRKVSKPAVQFLVELFRPSQLRVSPFLRGFYFTGVRPIVSRQSTLEPGHPQQQMYQPSSAPGATQVFRLGDLQPQPTPLVASPRTQERRIPQWVFLDRILQRVVLVDRVAMGITQSGVGLSVLRRGSMAAGIALLLTLCFSLVVTRSRDASLQDRVSRAIEGVADLTAPLNLAQVDELQRLDSLRLVTSQLSHYENEDRPPRWWLGMYTGERLYNDARRVYFERFRPLLLQRAFEGVKADLEQLRDPPTSDEYDRVYQSLKAYVDITAEPDSAEADFFGEVLTDRWLGANILDDSRPALAKQQFEFFGSELPYGNPYPEQTADPMTLASARAFLRDNATEDAFYQSVVGQFNRLPSARLAIDRPDTRDILIAPFDVPGAFTRAGWDSVQARLTSVDQNFRLATYVVGQEFYESLHDRGINLDSLPGRLLSKYESEYLDTWLRFLRGTRLDGLGQQTAEDKLKRLGSNQSPLFQLLAFVNSHTAMKSGEVSGPFIVLKTMLGPDSLPQLLVSEKEGLDYLRLVGAMADAVARMNADPRAGAAGVDAAARDGQTFVRDLALTFPADPLPFEEASEGLRVLLAAPFLAGGEIAAGGPRRAASLAAEEFCRVWRPSLFDKYPFRSDAVTDATIDDLNSLLNPQTGAYRKFIETIEGLQVTPSTDYTNFKTMADRVANALYQPGASAPALRFGLRMENLVGSQRVDVAVGTRIYQFAINRQELELVAWEPRSQVTVTVQTGVPSRPTEELQLGADPWKLFRFFRQSDWNEVRAGLYRVSWPPVAGVDMLAEVQMPVPVLDPDYLRNFTCPRQVAR